MECSSIKRWSWFCETGTYFQGWPESSVTVSCALLSQLHPSPTRPTPLFFVGKKAKPGIMTPKLIVLRSWWEETQTWMCELCIITFCGNIKPFFFSLSLLQVWGSSPLFLWGRGWKLIWEWDCKSTGAPGRKAAQVCPAASPESCPSPCFLSSCRFAHKEFLRKSLHMNHLAIFCTDRIRDLKVLQHKRRTSEWWSVHTY